MRELAAHVDGVDATRGRHRPHEVKFKITEDAASPTFINGLSWFGVLPILRSLPAGNGAVTRCGGDEEAKTLLQLYVSDLGKPPTVPSRSAWSRTAMA